MNPETHDFRMTLRGKLLKTLFGWKALSPEAMAAYAKANTAFYARFYEGCDTRDFGSLPLLKKSDVHNVSPYDLLARPCRDKVAYYAESTGSTGSPTPAFLTPLEFKGAAMMSRMSPYAAAVGDIFKQNRTCINGLAMEFTIAGPSFSDLMRSLGGMVADVGSRSTLATPERTARALARLKPSLVAATPVDFLCWMRIVEEDYPDDYPAVVESLRAVLSTAELCSRERSKRIGEAFGIVHIDVYACVEGFFTIPCPCGEKHVPDIYHVELFDDDLKPMGPWGRGRICFTNLAKRSSPLVRYLLDDTVTLSPSACPYGFKKSVVPHGRYELGVDLDGGSRNVEDFENVLFRHGLFGGYEVKVAKSGLTVRLERYGKGRVPVKALAADLRETFGTRATVKTVKFGTLTKYREVRTTKPILRLTDVRRTSRQRVPEVL